MVTTWGIHPAARRSSSRPDARPGPRASRPWCPSRSAPGASARSAPRPVDFDLPGPGDRRVQRAGGRPATLTVTVNDSGDSGRVFVVDGPGGPSAPPRGPRSRPTSRRWRRPVWARCGSATPATTARARDSITVLRVPYGAVDQEVTPGYRIARTTPRLARRIRQWASSLSRRTSSAAAPLLRRPPQQYSEGCGRR